MARARSTSDDDVRRDQPDLFQALSERVDILLAHVAAFDEGSSHFAKAIAVDLDVLLLGSLLAKLRLLDQLPFYDSALPFREDNVFPYHGLVAVGIGVIFPAFDDGAPDPKRFLSWRTWSSATAMTTHEGGVFSRKRLIHDGRNLEGAHEDLNLPEDYHSLTRGVGLGCQVTEKGLVIAFRPDGVSVDLSQEEGLLPNPVPPSLRQLAHEVLVSLATAHPSAFPRPEAAVALQTHHPAPFGIRGVYMKRTAEAESRESINWTFNHPLDPSQFLGKTDVDAMPESSAGAGNPK